MTKYYLIFFLLIVSHTSGQVLPRWHYDNTLINQLLTVTDIAHDGLNTFETIQDFDQLQSVYVQKLDSAGNLVYSDSIQNCYSSCENRMTRDIRGNIYVCGQRDYVNPNSSKIVIYKYDSLLNRLWNISALDSVPFNFYAPRIMYSIVEDKLYVVCGKSDSNTDHTSLLKFDTDGNLIRESGNIPTLALYCIRHFMDSKGNIFLGGLKYNASTDEDFTIIKIDTIGAITWSRSLNYLLDDHLEDLTVDIYGNVYGVGSFSDTSRTRVAKYDSTGNLKWIKNIPDFLGSKIITNNTSIFLAGVDSATNNKAKVVSLDLAGNIQAVAYCTPGVFNIVSLKLSEASDVYVLYSADSSGDFRWCVNKLDSSLNVKWSLTYPDTTPTTSIPSSLYVLNDGFLVAGSVNPSMSIVRFEEPSTVYITEIENAYLNYWPNPVEQTLNIKFSKSISNDVSFSLYGLDTRCILNQLQVKMEHGQIKIQLPILRSGIYFFRIVAGDRIYSGKLIAG